MGAIVALILPGIGILMIVKARGLGEQVYRYSDDALNLDFGFGAIVSAAICAFGITIYLLYVMLFS